MAEPATTLTTIPAKNPLTRQVVEHLRALIIELGLDDGAELPSQGAIATQLGVSRLVVREATRVLEAQGLVRAEQGRRLTVARPDARQLGMLFALMVRSDEEALLELLDVRRALELRSVWLAAERATTQHIQEMQAAIDAISVVAQRSIEAQADADGAFHEAVAVASGNRLMVMLTEALAVPLRQLRIRSLKGSWTRLGSLQHVVEGHDRVLDRIVARDPEGAVRCMAAHLDDTQIDLQVPAPGGSAPA